MRPTCIQSLMNSTRFRQVKVLKERGRREDDDMYMCGSTTKNLRIFTREDWNQNLLREGGGVERYTV